ncbi:MAG: phosphate butyryltransferase [Planctomycetes bacterium SM23_32]|nr:MAG: phosphate butyryltransferase [Planctomycetes bacterium SM23_32]
MKNLDTLVKLVEKHPVRKVAVAVAQDTSVLAAVDEARGRRIAEATLVGSKEEIHEAADSAGVALDGSTIVDEPDPVRAVAAAAKMVSSGNADILMKGYIHTDDFLRGVLDKESGLRTGSIMSHVFVAEVGEQNKLVFVTDGAMNIAPDLEQKAAILLNAVHLANVFGVMMPKVAVLAAVELVNPAMPATVDAACLAKMAERRQFVPACTVDGPFALDNAVSLAAAEHKKIGGPVAGQADILVVPNIEAGNMLAKSLVYFGHNRLVGLLVGAKAPVVLTSRADTAESKLLSIAGAVLMVNIRRALQLKIGKVHY